MSMCEEYTGGERKRLQRKNAKRDVMYIKDNKVRLNRDYTFHNADFVS